MTVTKKPNLVPPVSVTSTSTTAAKPASRRRTTTAKPVVAGAPVVKQPAASPVATPPAKAAVRRAPAARPVVKPAEVSKPVVKTAPATAKPVLASVVVPAAAVKPASPLFEPKAKKKTVGKKSKVVRDTFTIPAEEYLQIAVLKQRAQEEGRKIKKSELLRAGLAVLSALTTPQLLRALEQLAPVKTGRPPKK